MRVPRLLPKDGPRSGEPVTVAEFRAIMKRMVATMGVFGVMMTVALGLSYYNQRQADRQAKQIEQSQRDIQQSRFANTLSTCQDTNERNRNTLAELGAISTIGPARRPSQEGAAAVEATRQLINAILPFRKDCVAYAQERVKAP